MSVAKSSLKSFLNLISGAFSLRFLIALTNQKLFLPFYHTVSDNPPPHIKHLYPVRSITQFIDDLNLLQKHYEFIGIDKFIEISKNKKPNKKYCFLTFDDGLIEFYNVAAPILKERNIPAHVFLNSGFVKNQALMFRYKVSLIIDSLRSVDVDNETLTTILEILNINSNSKNDISLILLELRYEDTNILDQIAKLLNIDFDEYLKEYQPYMTEKQIDELLQDGFTFGAHSIDHPEYRFITLEEQINQTSESVNYIKKIYGFECFASGLKVK